MPNRLPAVYPRWPLTRRAAAILFALFCSLPVFANQAPIVDSFTATPTTPVPGQIVAISLQARDPDCATTCTSGCGLTILADSFVWLDNTGRTGQFTNSVVGASRSPFTATVDWTAPPTEGTYTITAGIADNGGMLCGGRKTTTATLSVTVSSVRPPVIDSFSVTPTAVNAGATATLAALAHDPEGRALAYSFTAEAGTISHASLQSNTATWTAPPAAGNVNLTCTVTVSGAPAVKKSVIASVTIGEYLGRITVGPYKATRLVALPDTRIAFVDGASGVLAVGSLNGTLAWVRRGLRQPAALAYLDTRLYVLERKASQISIWSLSGDRLGTIAAVGALPNDLTADPYQNELFLSDSNRGVVAVIDPSTGALRREVGMGILLSPTGVWAENGTLAVADPGRKRVFVFDRTGGLVSTLGDDSLLVRPQGVSRDVLNSNWIITDSFSGELHILTNEGTVLGTLGGYGNSGNLVNPMDSEFLLAQSQIAVPTLSDGVKFFGLTSTVPAPQSAGQPVVADRPGDDGEALLVAWTISPDDPVRVDRYFIERDNGDDAFVRVATLSAGSDRWTDLNAGDGQCHSYRIVASDGAMHAPSAPSSCEFAINDLPPATPTITTAGPTTPFEAEVQWTPVTSADLSGYVLDITGPEGPRSLTFGPGVTHALVASLGAAQQYTFTIRAFDTASNYSQTFSSSFTMYPDESPPAPSGLVASDTGDGGTVTSSWTIDASIVPVDHYQIVYEPSNTEWPSLTSTTTDPSEIRAGLVNMLSYSVHVRGVTPWGRQGAVATATVVPTAPSRLIPILQRAGREGLDGIEDSAGISVTVPFSSQSRELRFVYRTLATDVAVSFNGRPLQAVLPDTSGSWEEASIILDRTAADVSPDNLLQLVSTGFPAYTAEAAFDRLDLVPLPAARLQSNGFETVIDIDVTRAESRTDLALTVERGDSRATQISKVANPSGAEDLAGSYGELVDCRNPLGNVCRDAFRTSMTHFVYRVGIKSPAGWLSSWEWVQAQTHPPSVPPPVTDLMVNTSSDASGTRYVLDWTPLSYLDATSGEVRQIPTYRVYATDGVSLLLRGAVAQPPFELPDSMLPAGFRFIVRSVDPAGRESQ